MRGRFVILGVGAAAIAMLCFTGNASSARLVWNTTASAPTGLYSIEQGTWRVGDRVAVRPSASLADDLDRRGILPLGKLLIKRVVAGRDDTVCRDGERVTVNGSLAAIAKIVSRTGEALPSWGGCRLLSASEVLLLGDTPDSYDGRYFGVTRAEEIVGRLVRLVAFQQALVGAGPVYAESANASVAPAGSGRRDAPRPGGFCRTPPQVPAGGPECDRSRARA